MQALVQSKEISTSKYIKEPAEKVAFYRCAVFYIYALYVMPQYFGIPNPVFDLTIVRIGIVLLLVFIICDYTRLRDFLSCILHEKASLAVLPYVIVLLYTMVLRADINALLNPLIEILEMYLLIYVVKDSIGTDKTIKLIQKFIYILVILGIVEMIMKQSPFAYLVTIDGLYTGRYMRGGHYRIMSSCNHSIGYGMLLITAMPFAGLDVDTKKFDLFRRPFLLIGTIVNIFATGSRSSLGLMFLVFVLMLIMSDKEYFRRNVLIVVTSVTAFAVLTFLLQGTGFGKYILLQITSLIDSFFHTKLSAKFGADVTQLGQSASYRKLLKKVFKVSWLNPVLGIGRKRAFSSTIDGLVVQSIDNFYIAEFVRYAYPGMISYIALLLYMLIGMLRDMFKTRSATIRTLFIGALCYCLHLYIADSLQTLKYLYVLFALYLCCEKTPYVPEEKGKYFGKRESKYVRKSRQAFK